MRAFLNIFHNFSESKVFKFQYYQKMIWIKTISNVKRFNKIGNKDNLESEEICITHIDFLSNAPSKNLFLSDMSFSLKSL